MVIINTRWRFEDVKKLILNVKICKNQQELLSLINKDRRPRIKLRALQNKMTLLGINKRWSGSHPCVFFDRVVRKWTAFAIDDKSLSIKNLGYVDTEEEAIKLLEVFTFDTD